MNLLGQLIPYYQHCFYLRQSPLSQNAVFFLQDIHFPKNKDRENTRVNCTLFKTKMLTSWAKCWTLYRLRATHPQKNGNILQEKLKIQLQRSQQKDSPKPKFCIFSSDWLPVLNFSTFRAISHLHPCAIQQPSPAGFPQTSNQKFCNKMTESQTSEYRGRSTKEKRKHKLNYLFCSFHNTLWMHTKWSPSLVTSNLLKCFLGQSKSEYNSTCNELPS